MIEQELIDYEDFYYDFLTYQYRYYQNALTHSDKLVYKDMGMFSELIVASGFLPVMSEIMVALVPEIKSKTDILDDSNQYFYEASICSFNKVALPAFCDKLIPLPRAFVNTTVCQDVRDDFSVLADKFHVPHFVFDYPYLQDKAVETYLKKQYELIYHNLCILNQIHPDLDRIKECVLLANQAIEYIEKGNNLRKSSGAICYGGQMIKFTNILSFLGTKECVEIAKKYYETCVHKREEGRMLPCKYRLLWCNTAPIYDDDLFVHLEKTLGAVIVMEELNCVSSCYLDDKDPFRSLANRAVQVSFIGDLTKRIQMIIHCIREYHIDGVIFFEHQNCRMFNMNYRQIKAAVQKEGIKIIKITGDCYDKSCYSKEQLVTRLEGFVEML